MPRHATKALIMLKALVLNNCTAGNGTAGANSQYDEPASKRHSGMTNHLSVAFLPLEWVTPYACAGDAHRVLRLGLVVLLLPTTSTAQVIFS